MLDDGVKGQGIEDDAVKVADIAIHVLDSLTKKPAAPTPEVVAGE
jgi:hypothetical protein